LAPVGSIISQRMLLEIAGLVAGPHGLRA